MLREAEGSVLSVVSIRMHSFVHAVVTWADATPILNTKNLIWMIRSCRQRLVQSIKNTPRHSASIDINANHGVALGKNALNTNLGQFDRIDFLENECEVPQ